MHEKSVLTAAQCRHHNLMEKAFLAQQDFLIDGEMGHLIAPEKPKVAQKSVETVHILQYLTFLYNATIVSGPGYRGTQSRINFAMLTCPLNKSLIKGSSCNSDSTTEKARQLMYWRKKQITLPILAPIWHNRKYMINTDLCDIQENFELLQLHENRVLKPIDYWFSLLRNAETRYDTTLKYL